MNIINLLALVVSHFVVGSIDYYFVLLSKCDIVAFH